MFKYDVNNKNEQYMYSCIIHSSLVLVLRRPEDEQMWKYLHEYLFVNVIIWPLKHLEIHEKWKVITALNMHNGSGKYYNSDGSYCSCFQAILQMVELKQNATSAKRKNLYHWAHISSLIKATSIINNGSSQYQTSSGSVNI